MSAFACRVNDYHCAMKFVLGAVLWIVSCSSLLAQTYQLFGNVKDEEDQTEVIGAGVVLIPTADTTQKKGTVTDVNGKFEFANLTNGNYTLRISYLGYFIFEKPVSINGTDKNTGSFQLKRKTTLLKDVTVTEQQVRVVQKADTTEYNASAFKTNPDATAEDLIKKMPGITSENGVIKAQGEEVKKVTVDGKEFFGDDASVALKNLPSEIIDRVQVFDRMSDQARFTGFDDGNSQKGINIVTKNGRNNGVFGKIYAGYGYLTGSRYSAGATVNWFNGDRRITVLGMANNVNQQNFSTQDLLGVMGTSQQRGPQGGGGMGGRGGRGSSGRGGGGWGENPADNFLVGQQGGIASTYSAGLNYSDTWGKLKKVKVTGSYFFNLVSNSNETQLNRQYYSNNDSTTTYTEKGTSSSQNINHRFNLRLEYNIDTLNSITFTPKVSFQQNKSQNSISGVNTFTGNEFLSGTETHNTSKNFGYNIGGDLLYQHKFLTQGRTISLQATGSANSKAINSSQNSQSNFAELNDTIDIDQQTGTETFSYTTSGNITYTEPAGKTGIMSFSYQPSYSWNTSDKNTNNFDAATNSYTLVDSNLSSQFNNDYITHRGGFNYRYRDGGVNFSAGGNMQYATLMGEQTFPFSAKTSKSFLNLLPNAMLNVKFSDSVNLRVFYRTSTNPPTIAQLQNVIDNSNPLLLSMGNPDLQQNYSHFLMTRFSYTNTKKAQSFFAFASVNYTANNIVNSTLIAKVDTLLNDRVILRAGSQLTKPVNINGTVNANTFFTYSLPVSKIKSNLNFNLGYSYARNPSLVNNALNISNTNNINGGFVLSSNISEKIDFTVNYTANYNFVKNSLQTSANNNYYYHNAGLKFNWMFWKGFVFNTNLQNTLYAGVSQGFNQNFFLLNAALGYKFLKDKSLDVRFSVNDILNQNTGLSRSVTETYIEDSKTQVLKRYLMLTITYDLKFFKKPAQN